jgi:hypothetical protein
MPESPLVANRASGFGNLPNGIDIELVWTQKSVTRPESRQSLQGEYDGQP